MDENYLKINKESWNKRTEIHFNSSFYDNESFVQGRSSLNEIELQILGDLKGKKVLHLQCHFGQDTISLEQLGAIVTGVDLSDVAISKANELAKRMGSSARFICSDLYSLPNILTEDFDIVFTSYGTIGWLPDIHKWAAVVSFFLRKGGKFVFAEFHPVVWMFNDEFTEVKFRYFNDTPIVEEEGTYTDGANAFTSKNISWNHGLGEVFTSLISNGLCINEFKEFDYSPYDCFSGTKKISHGKYIIEKMDRKLPLVYSVLATKLG
ncbi:MAG: SAM-dependent methyltransferase [Salibacteraceae bacterium]|jgi:SAM-dependent methyltransferase